MNLIFRIFIFSILFSIALSASDIHFSKMNIRVGENKLNVEVAKKPEELEQGLMNRKNISESEGMLFIFPEEKTANFWMKNTLIPLSRFYIK